ncbi:MAG TPA: hypothetical protein VND22_07250 [Actinomycetota bacterium]|nr:hypothetical protein [Actinomycetota bacterium]
MPAQATDALDRVQRTVALGVTPAGQNRFRLALRVQRRGAETDDLVETIRKKAKNEVDVRYVGRVVRQAPWEQTRVRPLRIGTSIGHHLITAGTLGCFVKLKRGGDICLLSNNHVLANEDAAKQGDAILQPGTYDGGKKSQDVVGKLGPFVKLKKTGRNQVDAALAILSKRIDFDPSVLRGGGKLAGVVGPDLSEFEIVEKLGRTTGRTSGRISAFELDNVVVAYDMGNIRFDDQIEIESSSALKPFSQGGDSGSLIFTKRERLALGLLFAGSDQGGSNGAGLTYANPFTAVLSKLKAELVLDRNGVDG